MPAPCCGYVFFLSWLQWHRVTSLPPAPTAASDHGTFCEPPRAVRSGGLRRGGWHPVGLFRWESQPLLEADERPSQLADQSLTQNCGSTTSHPKWMAYPMLAIVMHPPRIKHFDSFRIHDYFDEFLLRAYQVANVVCFEYVSVPPLFGRRRQKKSVQLIIYILWRVKPPRGMCFTF